MSNCVKWCHLSLSPSRHVGSNDNHHLHAHICARQVVLCGLVSQCWCAHVYHGHVRISGSGFDVNFMDDMGQTLLNWASAFGPAEMVGGVCGWSVRVECVGGV